MPLTFFFFNSRLGAYSNKYGSCLVVSAGIALKHENMAQHFQVSTHFHRCDMLQQSTSNTFGSFYVSVKLLTYTSPKPTLTLSSSSGQNVG